MKQKREYERPRMNVVELKHQCRILTGSETTKSVSLQNYNVNEYYDE